LTSSACVCKGLFFFRSHVIMPAIFLFLLHFVIWLDFFYLVLLGFAYTLSPCWNLSWFLTFGLCLFCVIRWISMVWVKPFCLEIGLELEMNEKELNFILKIVVLMVFTLVG
jgi:hypothetical protein